MPGILILTASYGSGHNAAAASLAAAFARAGVPARVVDHFRDLVHPAFERASRALYYWTLRRVPRAWALAYAAGDRLTSDSRLTLGVTRLGAGRLAAALRGLAPAAVVTVHATPAVAMSWLARRGRPVPPHITVVTDFVAHGQWFPPAVDRYCVAAEEVRHDVIARGIPPERVVVTGVPVDAAFAGPPPDPVATRTELGLDPQRPVILAMAGARGVFGRLAEAAAVLRDLGPAAQSVVVAGHDAALAARLRDLTRGSAVQVRGYVSEVRRLMAAADVLVTKAGGMTLAEAMAAELPVITYGSLPGQERRNERFAARSGIALVARTRRDLAAMLGRALTSPDLLKHLRERMRMLARPEASRTIVDLVLAGDFR